MTLDRRLFVSWQAGDAKSCAVIWELFNARVFTVAVRFCCRFVDEGTARQIATTAFGKAWEELEVEGTLQCEAKGGVNQRVRTTKRGARGYARKHAGKKAIKWQGVPQLEAYVRNLVILRCRDELRARWHWMSRFDVPGDHDETEDAGSTWAVDELSQSPATQETDLLRALGNEVALHDVLRRLAAVGERCRSRPALLKVVVAMRDYFRQSLIKAGRHANCSAGDGRAWESLSLDELATVVDPELVEVSESEMLSDVKAQLGLGAKSDRNTIYQRTKNIRDIWQAVKPSFQDNLS